MCMGRDLTRMASVYGRPREGGEAFLKVQGYRDSPSRQWHVEPRNSVLTSPMPPPLFRKGRMQFQGKVLEQSPVK